MAKKRAHRNTVLKRKAERAQKELEENAKREKERLERETTLEMQRVARGDEASATGESTGLSNKVMRVVGDLMLELPKQRAKKQVSRKQAKRKEAARERGEAIAAQMGKKWEAKKRRVKQRAQIRNEDLHD
ncbi:uncharacterized protein TEOVI_000007100 [Trypanosoma equiperdum]|nr:hypothetical protein, conserved [Trypanosoma equiperdum]